MNKKLVLRTVEKDFRYLDSVESELILQELEQNVLPNGIIKKAFERGYIYSENTNELLKGKRGKTAIIEYLNMQEDKRKDDDIFNKTNYKVEGLMQYLSEDVLENEIVDIAKKKGYQIKSTSRECLKNRSDLALDYYRNIKIDDIDRESILSESLLANKEFLEEYFKVLEEKGLSREYILSTITKNKEFVETIKKDSNNIEFFLKTIEPKRLEEFLKIFYSDEEIKQVLTDDGNVLNGRLKRLSKLYKFDPEIISSENARSTDYLIKGMDGRLLNERYSDIPNNKLQIIARDPNLQYELLSLSNNEYKIYSLMSANISEKTDRWNEYDNNFIKKLGAGNYKELIDNIGSDIENDNITQTELENMIKLFSTQRTYVKHKNVFNITRKEHLVNYEQIRENVCNFVIENPSLNGELPSELEEHLVSFNDMSEIDRMKLAILQKTYGIDLEQAHLMTISYGNDIEEVMPSSDKEESIRETIMAIKGISECDDIGILKQVANLDILVKSDKALETILSNEAGKMYENLYKSKLYNPSEKDKIDTIKYNGKDISIYDAGTDFAMITKHLNNTNTKNSYKKDWNDLNPTYDDIGNKGFRYRTCTSYVTPENMCEPALIVGFSKSIENNSFDLIDSKDIHSNMYGDEVSLVCGTKKIRTPENLETETYSSEEGKGSNYNEIVINMLSQDEKGNLQKAQPDYVVYVKQKNIERENDEYWKSAEELASEFDIPIVTLDTEKIQESEKQKIKEKILNVDNLNINKDNKKLFKKIKHYKSRYGKNIGFDEKLEDKIKYFEDSLEDKFIESSSKSNIYLEELVQKERIKTKLQETKNVEEMEKNEEYGIY